MSDEPLNPKLYEDRYPEQSLLEQAVLQAHRVLVEQAARQGAPLSYQFLAEESFNIAEALVRERDRREAVAQAHQDEKMMADAERVHKEFNKRWKEQRGNPPERLPEAPPKYRDLR